ncbi:ribosome biogenesis GTPase YqeH [Atopobacter sp. AH10]|uniref:ribosome biogenesis GTPase YqeH n=1 Tax=Atopobacter sp. AH10 TaxID=2315861 RepID=UPI000EF203E8|nr:ribosome biogenesis GTPase YqeH [Atopobacter sp. AH10]RLK62925.1 ribosome biogenesis GTPase YqeH [Atopobacter sp. AH10]
MTILLNNKRCIGCGASLQTKDKEEPGYLPLSSVVNAMEKGENQMYCQRCFRLRHYNEISPVSLSNDDFRQLLSEIAEKDALIVYVMDVMDLYGSSLQGLHRYVGNNPVLAVVNKVDLLPKQTNQKRLKQTIQKALTDQGIHPEEIVLISAKKDKGLDDLSETIEYFRKGRWVYVVGVTNVGKSTLINHLIASVGGDKHQITTSYYPGTTLGRIEIPLTDGASLVDTPGIVQGHQLAHLLSAKDLKSIMPKKTLKPVTYQLKGRQTLFIGGFARVDFDLNQKSSVTTYLPNQLYVHRTKTDGADLFYQEHFAGLLTPPSSGEALELKAQEIALDQKTDIVFSGLGWICVNEPCLVRLWTAKGHDVVTRPALI